MMMMMSIVERVFCPGGRELSDSDKDSAENGEEEKRRRGGDPNFENLNF